jgi:hypothetical protein
MKPVDTRTRVLANDAVILARMTAPVELGYWQGAVMALVLACRDKDTDVVMALLNWTFSPYAWDEVEPRDAEDMAIAAGFLAVLAKSWAGTDLGRLAVRRSAEMKAVALSRN